MNDGILSAAERLMDCGLPRTALTLLLSKDIIGREVNNLRRIARARSESSRIIPGIYALGTDGDVGVVIPIGAELGSSPPEWLGKDDSETHQAALAVARRHVSEEGRGLPALRLVVPDELQLYGKSMGLAAGLAFVSKLCGREVGRPVIATGEVSEAGVVLQVSGMQLKLRAAENELRGKDGFVLVPPGGEKDCPKGVAVHLVASFVQALELVFGTVSLHPDLALVSFDQAIVRSQEETDHSKAIAILKSVSSCDLSPADRARLYFELGVRCRHTGDAQRAAELHEKARSMFSDVRDAYGEQVIEDMEIEMFATMLGQFLFNDTEPLLRDRLKGRFLRPHNHVRCRGMLAQLLSTLERHEEVVSLREQNLGQQRASDVMKREIPFTLCCLVFEAARAGSGDVFDRYAARLVDETSPGDIKQQRYNDSAVVRGMVLLQRHKELLSWLNGDGELFGHRPTPALKDLSIGVAPISKHPEISTARALIQALISTGRQNDALTLADRVVTDQPERTVRWLALLAKQAAGIDVDFADALPGVSAELFRRMSSNPYY